MPVLLPAVQHLLQLQLRHLVHGVWQLVACSQVPVRKLPLQLMQPHHGSILCTEALVLGLELLKVFAAAPAPQALRAADEACASWQLLPELEADPAEGCVVDHAEYVDDLWARILQVALGKHGSTQDQPGGVCV